MGRSAIILFVALSTISFAQNTRPAAASHDMPPLQHFSPDRIDKSLDPCTDFFEYACAKWIKANPIPPDQAGWGTFSELAIWNIAAIHHTLEEAAAASNRTPAEQKAGDYYAACMDESKIDRLGMAPVQPLLDRISALKEKWQLPELVALLHQNIRPANLVFTDVQYQGILFGVYAQPGFDNAAVMMPTLDQSGMGLPGREFYSNQDERSKQIREKYVSHVAKMLKLTGETEAQATADSQAVLAFETELAKAAMEIVARRDPKNQNNKMTLAQVQAMTPSFNWNRYFAAVHAPSSQEYLVLAPTFFQGVEKLVASEPLEHWRAYLLFETIHLLAPFLSQPFVEENFSFYGRVLAGSQKIQPRWRRCSAGADIDLGEALGQAYVAKYFPPESKERMLRMVKNIEATLNGEFDSATWMSASTKQAAHAKLAAQIDKIGYPDHWRDYSGLEITREDYLGNVERASLFEFNRRIAEFNKPTDRYDWNMTPPTVNAYEDPQSNTINFPAGILQPPFFDPSQIDAVNYGAIGAVIGHEITHGYDDQGRKFDAQGDLHDWWTAQDAASYDERDQCIQDEYTQEVPEAGVKQNGKLSAGEDTADNGGIHLALGALQKDLKDEGKDLDSATDDGMSELQNFFLSYANVWCGELRPELAHTAVMTQGHSLNRYRVDNVVANMPEFAHAFSCHAGQPMVHAKQCRVW